MSSLVRQLSDDVELFGMCTLLDDHSDSWLIPLISETIGISHDSGWSRTRTTS